MLKIMIPTSFFLEKVKLNWHDIQLGIQMGYFSSEAAIDFAKQEIGSDGKDEGTLIDLICLPKIEIELGLLVNEYVEVLAQGVFEEKKKNSKDKILYLVLLWIYENQEEFEDPLVVISVAHAEFDYPSSISNLIFYRASKDQTEVGRHVLFRRWEKYLREEAVRWGGG